MELPSKVKPKATRTIVVERKRQEDVDDVVFRLRTTKNSGYHTRPRRSCEIFRMGLWEVRKRLHAAREG